MIGHRRGRQRGLCGHAQEFRVLEVTLIGLRPQAPERLRMGGFIGLVPCDQAVLIVVDRIRHRIVLDALAQHPVFGHQSAHLGCRAAAGSQLRPKRDEQIDKGRTLRTFAGWRAGDGDWR